ncbi:MAG: SRPBCC domain-containing protein [Terracidiphilus sp.]
MSATAILTPQENVSRSRKVQARGRERRIALRLDVAADRRRIFDALTVPEYIETWLSFPCTHVDCRTIASQANDHYRLDHYAADRLDFSITGAYHVCRRGKLFFTWRKAQASGDQEAAHEGMVLIRLHGAFAKSTLCLAHTGFFSEREYRWHRELWNRSLTKLQALFCTR